VRLFGVLAPVVAGVRAGVGELFRAGAVVRVGLLGARVGLVGVAGGGHVAIERVAAALVESRLVANDLGRH